MKHEIQINKNVTVQLTTAQLNKLMKMPKTVYEHQVLKIKSGRTVYRYSHDGKGVYNVSVYRASMRRNVPVGYFFFS